MTTIRRSFAIARTAFFVLAWSMAAFVPLVYGIVKENVGYIAISIAMLIVGGITTRAPDEAHRSEGLAGPLGRFMLGLALCLGILGGVMVWRW